MGFSCIETLVHAYQTKGLCSAKGKHCGGERGGAAEIDYTNKPGSCTSNSRSQQIIEPLNDLQTWKLDWPGSDHWGVLWLQCVSALCQQVFVCVHFLPPVVSTPESLVMLNLVMPPSISLVSLFFLSQSRRDLLSLNFNRENKKTNDFKPFICK